LNSSTNEEEPDQLSDHPVILKSDDQKMQSSDMGMKTDPASMGKTINTVKPGSGRRQARTNKIRLAISSVLEMAGRKGFRRSADP
jgi:hypothetical protein